ncbi:MAG: adenylate/guanylate cyclase domain-containing protein [Opitutaceae bacterium]|nr:adenylate/guanylate cyclase domain-containing protein [Opitutaceae bacterium]
MESFPPYPSGPGQRTLAAIVFTDVVGFSARVQADEANTLRLLDRDFAAMRALCDKYSGSVLKSTGDGLLLYFSSAVQAVACALKIQRHFAEVARTHPPDQVLSHRVGIHLGDVIVSDQDVMGDGVNIASRLQAEAEPGGICISQTVYDVVKNKLALKATRLGPRELKNISEAIPVYRLLLEAQAMGSGGSHPPAARPATRPPGHGLSRTQKLAGAGGLALLLALAVALGVRGHFQRRQAEARAAATQEALASLLGPSDDEAERDAHGRMIRAARDWREELREHRSRLLDQCRPEELTRSLRDAPPAERADRQRALERIQGLFSWVTTSLQRYSRESPLVVRELTGTAPRDIKVYVGADRRLYHTDGGATRQRDWHDLRPPAMGAIVAGTLLDAPRLPPREVVQGAQAFAYLYGVPELIEALRQGPRRPTGDNR